MVRPATAITPFNTNHKMINIDPKKVIAFFGGPTAVQRRLKKSKVEISLATIEKWSQRSNMPASRFAQLALCAKQDGSEFDLYEFINAPKHTRKTNKK